jgi:hypothetical protein
LLAVVLAVVAVVLVARRRSARLRLLAVLITPVFVLLPWSMALVRQPSLIFLEAGLPGPSLSDTDVSPLALLLLHPGGPAMYPVWISAGILLAGFAALLRSERRRIVTAGWALTLAGLVVGLFMSRIHVTGPTLITAVPAWPGFATVVMGAGLLLAALIGAEGARDRIAASNFGWQQPLSVGVTLLAIIAPAVAGLWWIRFGADDPVERRNPVVLPQFVAMDGQTADRPRTLVLRPRTTGLLSYSLLRDVGPRLGDAETAPRRGTYAGLDQIVTEIVTGRGQDEIDQLADYAIRYVLLTSPVDGNLVRTLDGVPGLSRVSVTEGNALWRLEAPAARLRIVPHETADTQMATKAAPEAARAVLVPSAEVGAHTSIPAGPAGRLLVLAENADSGWRATLGGSPLEPTVYNGWAQAFVLPADGGQLDLVHHSSSRNRWLLVQLLATAVVIVLALPGGRRTGEILAVDETMAVERRRRGRTAGLPEEPVYLPAPGAAVPSALPEPGDFPDPGYPEHGYPMPGHPEPAFPEPGYPDPGYPEPAFPGPGYPEPAYRGPEIAQPLVAEPYVRDPGFAQPAYAEAGYYEPDPSGAGFEDPTQTYAFDPATASAGAQPDVYHGINELEAYADEAYDQIPYEQLAYNQDGYSGLESPPYGQQLPAQPARSTGEQPAYVHAETPSGHVESGPRSAGMSHGHPGYDPYIHEPPVPRQGAPDAVTASYEVVGDEPYGRPAIARREENLPWNPAAPDRHYGHGGPPGGGYEPPAAAYGYGEPPSSYLDPTVGPYEQYGAGPDDGSQDEYGYDGAPYPDPASSPTSSPVDTASYEPDTGHIERVRRSGRHAGKPAEQVDSGARGDEHDHTHPGGESP